MIIQFETTGDKEDGASVALGAQDHQTRQSGARLVVLFSACFWKLREKLHPRSSFIPERLLLSLSRIMLDSYQKVESAVQHHCEYSQMSSIQMVL